MGIFSWLGLGNNNQFNQQYPNNGAGTEQSSNELTYWECKEIFRNHALGKRLALALPTFSLSSERKIVVKDTPPEVVELYQQALNKLNIIDNVKRFLGLTRAYGMCALYIACEDKAPNEALTFDDIWNRKISLNVLDPLNIAGVFVNQDPTSVKFQKVETIMINGAVTNPKRCLVLQNDYPLYLMFSSSNFSFGGASIYQNMQNLLEGWETCIKALNRMCVKAGSIILKSGSSAHASGVNISAMQRNLQIINSLQNDGIANIDTESSTEFFSLTGVVELDKILQNFNNSIALALSDTPMPILLNAKLSNGLNDGTEDMKTIIMAVESYRTTYLQKVFNFLDPLIMAYAWNENELIKLKRNYYQKFKHMGLREMFSFFRNGFSYEWGSLYPITEKEKLETDNMKMNLLMGARELGANISDLNQELQKMNIFSTNMDLMNANEYNDFLKDEQNIEALKQSNSI